MMVATGLDPEAFHTIDTGVSRSFGDALTIKGETNTYDACSHIAPSLLL